jgi:hypothetical protein
VQIDLSDSGESITASQPLETIDLLKPEENPDQQHKLSRQSRGAEAVPAGGFVPAESIRLADEEECLRRMPPCEATAPLRTASWPAQEAGSSEEQEERLGPVINSKAIEERLKQVLRSYLNNGKWGHAGVDTLEFRPSDAKKGEFDRIPF